MAMKKRTRLSEVLEMEVLPRLPLKTIFQFKLVCKKWKSTIESAYFRRHFLSLNQNSSSSSSSSWSIMCGEDELIVFHGQKTWEDLPKSPSPLIPPSFRDHLISGCFYKDSSGGLVLVTCVADKAYCYVGSPVTNQWVKIPPPPSDPKGTSSRVFGLVTRLDEDGVVLSFKLIRKVSQQPRNDYLWSLLVYSSDTGVWTSKLIHTPHVIDTIPNHNINGTIYIGCTDVPGILLTHDFYSESDQFRIVQLPEDVPDHNEDNYKRTLTTSEGSVVYVTTLAKQEETVLKIWRLNNDDDDDNYWHLLWEVGFPITGGYAPLAMHPFDVGTVYLWSLRDHHLVSCNLRKQDYTVLLRDDASNDDYHQYCFIDKSRCDKILDALWSHLDSKVCVWLFQFVIPRWMESLPPPPQAEMIDTTSLLSHAAATHDKMMRETAWDDYIWMLV